MEKLGHETVSGQAYEGRDLEALAELPNYHQWILETFDSSVKGRVLELGAGTGNFSSSWLNSAQEAVLIEPARNLFALLAARFASIPHVQPVCGYLEELCEDPAHRDLFYSHSFDAAILVNVLEHIEHDLQTLRLLKRLLRPDGHLLLFVPALSWLYGSLDAEVDHVCRYSRSGLRRTVRRAGFHIKHLRYFDLPGVMPWFFAARVCRVRRFNERMARVYDSLVVPMASFAEKLFRPPLGKNLICVAQNRVADQGLALPAEEDQPTLPRVA